MIKSNNRHLAGGEQRTRKQKNKKQKKKQDCTPKGGSSGRELGLVILLFLFF